MNINISLVCGYANNGRGNTLRAGYDHVQAVPVPLYPLPLIVLTIPGIFVPFQIFFKNRKIIFLDQQGMNLVILVAVDMSHAVGHHLCIHSNLIQGSCKDAIITLQRRMV